ncbi:MULTISPECIES: hypothetical protein [Amycolatopsis]|uniref:Integral membrane protein n=1 Tax=Amycolatopsis bullii TaxID=941987 RepID=A0ABQ3K220_9PSEU|nr:hypothetical protein [Amycolatopsis bullii]GHF98527.1 hypothetical protein GCM10017567_11570 [Amycolatopsis bullii]
MRELVRRCLVAMVSGLLALFALRAFPYRDVCTGPACIFAAMFVVPLVVIGAALLAYPLMALGRVRPAWPVALVGPLVVLSLVTTVLDLVTCPFPVVCVAVAGSYAFAALVTADGLPRAWRVVLAAPAVVLFAWGVVWPILS